MVPAVQMLRNFGDNLGYSGCSFANFTGSCVMKNYRDFRVSINSDINQCDTRWFEPALGGPAGVSARDGAHQSLALRHIKMAPPVGAFFMRRRAGSGFEPGFDRLSGKANGTAAGGRVRLYSQYDFTWLALNAYRPGFNTIGEKACGPWV